ncbi:uncharacterized protein TrAtP1_006453 [Trichoderma atroviride]|uniref:uncharacterized protein n=1 Tax=Hypocrea atroviridis TaxID=63577 RepID=UPI00331C3939|nr:hypothetical protein TrAtP1_006453 [Trichoderma atroviride]
MDQGAQPITSIVHIFFEQFFIALRAQRADCWKAQGAQGAYEDNNSSTMDNRLVARNLFSSLVQVSDVAHIQDHFFPSHEFEERETYFISAHMALAKASIVVGKVNRLVAALWSALLRHRAFSRDQPLQVHRRYPHFASSHCHCKTPIF